MSRAIVALAFGLFVFVHAVLGAPILRPRSYSEPPYGSSALALSKQPKDPLKLRIEETLIIRTLDRIYDAVLSKNRDSLQAAITGFNDLQSRIHKTKSKNIDSLMNGYSLLHYTVCSDDAEAVEMLIKAGASPFVLDTDNRSPLSYVGSIETLEALLASPECDTASVTSFIDKVVHFCDAATVIRLIPFTERYDYYRWEKAFFPQCEPLLFSVGKSLESFAGFFLQWKEYRPTAGVRCVVDEEISEAASIDRPATNKPLTLSSVLASAGVTATPEEIGAFAGFISAYCILNSTVLRQTEPDLLSVHAFASVLAEQEHFEQEVQNMEPMMRAYVQELRSLLNVRIMAKLFLPLELHHIVKVLLR